VPSVTAAIRPFGQRERAETTHGPDHPTVATRINNLALVLQDLGQLTPTTRGRSVTDATSTR
jgi:hypothetical protein